MWNCFAQFHAMLANRHDCQQQRKLPRVLPIMQYNGERAWTASTGLFRSHARVCGSPPLIAGGHDRFYMPHTSTGVPSYSSLRWKIFSFHGFALRSKITRWPASAPHRSM